MDNKTQRIEKINPDFKLIYSDIINKRYPEKAVVCHNLLAKRDLSVMDILELNKRIFGKLDNNNQKYRSYSEADILQMLDYQEKNRLNNTQLANHFKLSRNSVAKWRKMFF